MPAIQLRRIQEEIQHRRQLEADSEQFQVIVGMDTPAIATGARQTMKAILEFIQENDLKNVRLRQTGNNGYDSLAPIVQIARGNGLKISYGKVTPEVAKKIMAGLASGKFVEEHRIEI